MLFNFYVFIFVFFPIVFFVFFRIGKYGARWLLYDLPLPRCFSLAGGMYAF